MCKSADFDVSDMAPMCLKIEHRRSPVLFQDPMPGNLCPDGSDALGFRGSQRGHQHQPTTGSL